MSQPPPVQPICYASGYVKPPSPRPTSVTVLAIIGIIWGSLGVLGSLCSMPQALGIQIVPNPMLAEMHRDSLLATTMVARLLVNLILSIMILYAGISALSLKRSARKLMIVYAWAYIVVTVISIPLELFIVQPKTQAAVRQAIGNNPGLNANQVNMFAQIGVILGIGMMVLALIWPAFILYYMTRPHVIAAFERGMTLDAPLPPSPSVP